MRASVRAVNAESLGNRAAAVLRDAIVAGRLLPGTRLVEVQLAENLGVSRGTLRQALRELEHAGLVISVPYRGTYVAEQTPNSLRDAYSLRGLLEGYAATLIPADALAGVLSAQKHHLDRMRRALTEGRPADVAAIDIDFHTPICAAAGNLRLQQTWESLSAPLQARYANQVAALYTPAEIIARHEAIMASLEAGDPVAVEAGIRSHYLETARRMVAEMEAVSDGSHAARTDVPAEGGQP